MFHVAVAQRLHRLVLEGIAVQVILRFVRGIRNDDQQRGQQIIGDQRRAAGGHVRQGQAGERNDQRDAANHGEHLECHGEHQAGGQQLAETVLDLHGGDHTGGDDQQIQHQCGQQAGQTKLLAGSGVDVVGVGDRRERRMPLPQAGAHHATGSQTENAGDQLVRSAIFLAILLRTERVQPGVDARADMTEDVRRQECARGEGDEADDDPAFAAGGHIQHGYEHGEEHQRGAQIVLNHEHAHGHDPHHDDRAHILDSR